jgi:glutamate-5-semialdehyde dehydrogenase
MIEANGSIHLTGTMTAPLKSVDSTASVASLMQDIGRRARKAARALALAPSEQKDKALHAMAKAIRAAEADILAANEGDVTDAKAAGVTGSFLDRLTLDTKRIEAMAEGLEVVARLKDPVGEVITRWERPNGMTIERVRTPIGVIGVIYESRPNVTADAGALCLKSGNAAILRGGSDSHRSSRAIHAAMVNGLRAAGLPEDAVQLVPVRDRAAVGEMLSGLGGNVDVIVPRGGKSLVARVQEEARVPLFAHLEGICHVYIDKAAKPAMAQDIALNAKMRRTGVCGAAETLLIDKNADQKVYRPAIESLLEAGCEIRGDDAVRALDPRVKPAGTDDFGKEFLDTIIAARFVDGVDGAMAHIEQYGSQHTDAIVTQDEATAERFLNEVDSAIVLHNASTQFADGGEFGFGAEIGIATGRMHARGPVGVEQLTSFKYRVRGSGQTRP